MNLRAYKLRAGMRTLSQIECLFWCAVYPVPKYGPEVRRKTAWLGSEEPISVSEDWGERKLGIEAHAGFAVVMYA